MTCQSISMLSETLLGIEIYGETINTDPKVDSGSFLTILLSVIWSELEIESAPKVVSDL
jgi:hypothetical protein